jgi:hypothetical protein
MALWLLEASARRPLRVWRGGGHMLWASHWVERTNDAGPEFVHTFLLEVFALDKRVAIPEMLRGLLNGSDIWDVAARPAPDGTYPDLVGGRVVVVRDGAVAPESLC